MPHMTSYFNRQVDKMWVELVEDMLGDSHTTRLPEVGNVEVENSYQSLMSYETPGNPNSSSILALGMGKPSNLAVSTSHPLLNHLKPSPNYQSLSPSHFHRALSHLANLIHMKCHFPHDSTTVEYLGVIKLHFA
jgi:hypothetical protein